MNYNLLWFLWLGWSLILIFTSLGWQTSLQLICQYPMLLTGLISTIVAGVVFRNLLHKKELAMFKRKEKIIHQTDQSLSMQSNAYLPDESEGAEKSDVDNTTSMALPDVSDTTTIPETCLIVGEISAVGDIHINGSVNGIINSDKTVFVQKNGRVDGEVHAKRIEISGKLTGVCRSLELAVNAGGHLDRTIECESLSVNQHGRFYGHSKPYESKPQEAENKAEQKLTAPLVTLSHDFQFGEQTLM